MTLSDRISNSDPVYHLVRVPESVTSRTLVALPIPMSLDCLASEIVRLSARADHATILAAEKLIEFKTRIKRGEIGFGVDWMEELKRKTGLKDSRIKDLLKIGRATDKQKALEQLRERNNTRARRKRSKDASISPERRELLKFVRDIPETEVLTTLNDYRAKYPELFVAKETY